jgi:large subunit ribosomal protein L44e
MRKALPHKLLFPEPIIDSKRCLNYRHEWQILMNLPKEVTRYCPKCNTHTKQKISQYKAGKRRGSAIGERRHAEDKKGYGGQKFPKLAKPAKTTKKFTPILTCTVCKKKWNKPGIRVRKVELIAK